MILNTKIIILSLMVGTTLFGQAQSKKNQKTNINMTAKEVVMAYAEALGKGDIPTAFSYFSSEAKWNQPGTHRFSGLKSGVGEIGQMLNGMMEAAKGTFALSPNGNIMDNGNFVAMPVRFKGTIEDRVIDMTGVDLFEVKNGKIINVWLFSDDQEKEDLFWEK